MLSRGFYWLALSVALVSGLASQADATLIDFEGIPNFTSPAATIPGITISPAGGILDEAGVSLVTGLVFTPGTVATSGTSLLGNLFGAALSITFDTAVQSLSVQTVGSIGVGDFGTITAEAFAGAISLGTVASSPAAIGDSGAPEAVLSFGALTGITSVAFTASPGGSSTFLLDDLSFSAVPEPGTVLFLLTSLAALVRGRHAR